MHRLLLSVLLLWLSVPAFAQSFTIVQNLTGNPAIATRGQSFKPIAQGSGSGSTGLSNTVILKSISVVYHVSATSEAPKLYIYSSQPSNAATLTDGTSGTLVAESVTAKDDFPYTTYTFNNIEIDKNKTYYALFREDVALEFGSALEPGPYDGGQMIKNESGTLTPLITADLRMIVNLEQFQAPSMSVWTLTNHPLVYGNGGTGFEEIVVLNVEATKTLTIKNGGPGILKLGAVEATGAGISVSVQPAATVKPGGSTTLELTCSSAVDTVIKYNISIPNNDPRGPFSFTWKATYDYPIPRPKTVHAVNFNENQINVYWEGGEGQNNEVQFAIERSISSNTDFQVVANANSGSTRFEDKSVTKGVTYYYRMRGIQNNGDVSAYVYTNSVTAESNRLGDWEQKTSFPGLGRFRSHAVGFSIGTKGYFGLGSDSFSNYNDFWEYDPVTNTWTRKADYPGGARANAVAFVIDGKAYVGLGSLNENGRHTAKNDFYVYDPLTNSWSEVAEMPDSGGYSVAFVINGKAYIGLMLGATGRTFYEYDPALNTWRKVANIQSANTRPGSSFVINNIGYVYFDTELHAFDPSVGPTGTWTRKTDLPFSSASSNFEINNKGYVIGGTGHATQIYDPSNDSWSFGEPYPGIAYKYIRAFVIGQKGYVGLGHDWSRSFDFWEYNPISPKLTEISAEAFRDKVVLNWEKNADNEIGYVLERGQTYIPEEVPQNFTKIADLEPGTLTYTDTDVVKNVFYTYRIRTKFPEGESNNKSINAVIEYPSNLNITEIDETSFNLEWTVEMPAPNYVVEQATSTELNEAILAFEEIKTTSSTSHNATLDNEGFHYFRVRINRYFFPSTLYSDTVKVLMIKAPGNLQMTESTNSSVILTWEDRSAIETGYEIERKRISEPDFVAIARLDTNSTNYTDTDIEEGTQYEYRIKALKDTYDSFYSNVITISTITGIEDMPYVSLQVYPNPTSDILMVSIQNGDQLKSLSRAVSTDGRVFSIPSQVEKDTMIFDVSNLHQGLYILIITTKKGISKIKFMKE